MNCCAMELKSTSVSMTPLGKPVVPEVYCMLMASQGSRLSCRAWYSASSVMTDMDRISGTEYMPRCFSAPRKQTRRRCGRRAKLSRSRLW